MIGIKRDGRREFNEAAVQELVQLYLNLDVSIARQWTMVSIQINFDDGSLTTNSDRFRTCRQIRIL
ncbi:hypothetical protein [Paraburkholderia susongensis]|uniref:Uncharacterized protein n=1 Tax=Paraburkholderia susongensis TaxID=1515439 RepID=A0A1X7M4G3_9BURK|nr:hypothetical protein [Paraburkholderia susongensis]SMG61086.1 hypothetical protein SAMN06265784_11949 [Paraburkholderia susongensis]